MPKTVIEKLARWPVLRRDRVFYLAVLPLTVMVVGITPYLFQAFFFPGPIHGLLSLSLKVMVGAALMGALCYGLTRLLSNPRLRNWGPSRRHWPLVSHVLILWIPAVLLIDAPLRLSELQMLGPAALSPEIIPYIMGVSFGRAFLFAGGIVFYERLIEAAIQAADYRQKALLLETQTLKTLIQPHFMLNSLNAIRANIEDAPEVAEQMILSLTYILRMVIEYSGKERITLKEEMDLVNEYVTFMNRRFESSVQLNIGDRARSSVSIPPLIIFSLVENSFKHGFSQSRQGSITVSAEAGDMYRLVVDDDGTEAAIQDSHGGTGGQYVSSRLELAFGDRFVFTHGRLDNGHYQAVIEIPWERDPGGN
ncbi:MAG: histidine kinase [Nitrospinota bacterium]|nr:histidine kinase [Nitrospinota bacterium]